MVVVKVLNNTHTSKNDNIIQCHAFYPNMCVTNGGRMDKRIKLIGIDLKYKWIAFCDATLFATKITKSN